jgi:hypothetical protein
LNNFFSKRGFPSLNLESNEDSDNAVEAEHIRISFLRNYHHHHMTQEVNSLLSLQLPHPKEKLKKEHLSYVEIVFTEVFGILIKCISYGPTARIRGFWLRTVGSVVAPGWNCRRRKDVLFLRCDVGLLSLGRFSALLSFLQKQTSNNNKKKKKVMFKDASFDYGPRD